MELSSHERNSLSELSFRDLWEGPLQTDSEAGSSWSVGPWGPTVSCLAPNSEWGPMGCRTFICGNRWPLGQRKSFKEHQKTWTESPCPLYFQDVFSRTLEVSAIDIRVDFSGSQIRLQMELS